MEKSRLSIVGLVLASCTGIFLMFRPLQSQKPLSFTPTQAEAQTVSADWPQVQHDAGHTGYITDTYGPPYTVLWRWDGSSSPAAPPISTRVQPVIAYNFVYLPSDNGTLYAVKTADGKVGWSFKATMPFVNAAAVDTTNGIVVAGSLDHYVYGLNATTGAKVWAFQTSGMVRVAPVIAENTVFIANTKGMLYALNVTNGTQKWATQLDNAVLDTPGYYNGTIYVSTFASSGYSVSTTTGQVNWKKQLSGQGTRDRWVSAGNGAAFFSSVPVNVGYELLQNGTDMLTPIATTSWANQRAAILNFINTKAANRAQQVFDTSSGAETDPPILYTSGGSNSEHTQPVILPNGKFNVIYRYTEGIANGGCGATCITWSIYLGEYDKSTNDIAALDTWGTGSTVDKTKKVFSHTDESTGLMRTGSIVYLSTSRGVQGFDTVAKKIVPFVVFDTDAGDSFSGSPITFYSVPTWGPAYPGAEVNSDGNDYARPVTIANGVFYILHNSTIMAVKGTKL